MGNTALASGRLAPKNALTNKIVSDVRPSQKQIKLFDGRGLLLLVAPRGGKWWRFRFRFEGKHQTLALGTYPSVSLARARKLRDEARQLLAQGINPAAVRRADKAREISGELAADKQSKVRVSATIDGTIELWKGRAMLSLTPDEARGVNALLARLTT